MMPAANTGGGSNTGFPDVCGTPSPAGPVPVPYPNIGMNAQAMPICANVMLSASPAQNMGAKPTMTSGMEGGVAHPMIKGPGGTTSGCPTVQINGLAAKTLLSPSTGNGNNNGLGAQAVPSPSNVLMGCRADLAAMLDLRRIDGQVRAERAVTASLHRGVGTLRIARLSFHAGPQARLELAHLAGHGCHTLVLDLRGNPGGALFAAAEVAGLFLPYGTLLGSLRGTALRATGGAPDLVTPLRVRIDGHTASSAEILAAALAEHRRAVVVGERSYGKGRVATLAGRAIGEFHTPSGAPLEGAGVSPSLRSALGAVGAA